MQNFLRPGPLCLLSLPLLSLLPPAALAAPLPCPDGSDLIKVELLDDSTKLQVCGTGTLDGMHGRAYVNGTGEGVPIGGGVSETRAPFEVQNVSVRFLPNGLELTELLPVDTKTTTPSYRYKITCRGGVCAPEKNKKCVFRRPRLTIDKTAFKNLQKYWRGPVPSFAAREAIAEVLKDTPAPAGDSSSTATDSTENLLIVYGNALAGHQPSLKLLTDRKLNEKLNKADEGELGEPGARLYNVIFSTLTDLKDRRCLK